MYVTRAESMGMCFGVRDAVARALEHPRRTELTVLGELVHNAEVLRRLRGAGVRIAPSIEAPVETPLVMITAHGASDRAITALKGQGLEVEQATCPLVTHAHRSVRRLADAGYFPVIIGRREHVEVRGLVEDLDAYAVIERPDEIASLPHRARYGVASQTTQPISYVLEMVDRIRAAFPEAEVRFCDTVCAPTKERQTAARRLAASCDVVIVVGGRNSNNTRQLVRACEAEGARAYQVEGPADLQREWFDGAETVGLTAGTSTPDEVIEAVHDALIQIGRGEIADAA